MTAIDPDFERHRQFWLGFARFMRWAVGFIVVILILMAYFLL